MAAVVKVAAGQRHLRGAAAVGIAGSKNHLRRGAAVGQQRLLEAAVHLLAAESRLVVGHHDAPKLAHRVLRTGLVELLEVLDLGAAQPVGRGANVGALYGFLTLQLHAALADAEAVDDQKEVGAVLALQHQQVAEVVAIALGRAEAHQSRLGHAENGHDDLEEEGGVNVGGFIDEDHVGAGAAGGLHRVRRVTEGGTGAVARDINAFIWFPSQSHRPERPHAPRSDAGAPSPRPTAPRESPARPTPPRSSRTGGGRRGDTYWL